MIENEPTYRFFCQKCKDAKKVSIDDMVIEKGIAFGLCPDCGTWFSHRQPGDYSVVSKIMDADSPEGRAYRAKHSNKYTKIEVIDNKRAAPMNQSETRLFNFICPKCHTQQMVNENEADVKMKFADQWHLFFNCLRCKEQVEIATEQLEREQRERIEAKAKSNPVEEFNIKKFFDEYGTLWTSTGAYDIKLPKDVGVVSDGYHTFDSLYNQRLHLFATLVNLLPDKAWKSQRHHDNELCFGGNHFIVGIETPEGPYSYHYHNEHWDLFNCKVLERAPEWDGHTDKDVARLLSLVPSKPGIPLKPDRSVYSE